VSWNQRSRYVGHGALAVAVVGLFGLAGAATPGDATQTHAAAGRTARVCRVPNLVGLTLSEARVRAGQAGCAVRTRDVQAPGPRPQQRIVQQAPLGGHRAHAISVWLVPRCPKAGPTAPLTHEPSDTAGPAELISGIYLSGGPATPPWMCPRVPAPSAGTISVINPATGATVASADVVRGQLATIALTPGTYTIEGTDSDAHSNGIAMNAGPQTVTIPAGMTVRQDIFVSVP
jgi:hypothetical protein